MNSPSQRRRPLAKPPSRSRRRPSNPLPGLLLLCGLLYAIAGLTLGAFSVPPWVWLLALAGTLAQVIALAGSQALQRFKWLTANLLVLLSIGGAGALAMALSIAFNQAGTDQLDDLTLGGAFWEVLLFSLLAVVLTALCSLATAALGDRLLRHFQDRPTKARQTVFMLAATCLLGLGLGAAFGLLIP